MTHPDQKIAFGKYKGLTFNQILDRNPGYILWLYEENVVVFHDDKFIEDAYRLDAENSPPESYFLPDLGSK